MNGDIHQQIKPVPGVKPAIPNVPTFASDIQWREAFAKKWAALGGAPGKQIGEAEPVANGHRQRYEGGTLYADANLNVTFVYGKIGEKYDQMGGPTSWLGFPTSDEQPMSEAGRANTFEHGTIYFWDDTGAIELAGVILHYTGFICFGEADFNAGRGYDTPYAVVGVTGPYIQNAVTTRVYDNVNKGNTTEDVIELYRGQPVGLVIAAQLMQHGIAGDSSASVKAKMEDEMVKGAKWLEDEIKSVAVVGPTLADICGPYLEKVAPQIGDTLAGLLGLVDTDLGSDKITLTAKQMVVDTMRMQTHMDGPVPSKVQTALMCRQGASYKLCFNMIGMPPI